MAERRSPSRSAAVPEKRCAVCGRRFQWQARWRSCWEQVRVCSARCRRDGVRRVDRDLEEATLALLATRSGSLCPSEVARSVRPDDWRPLMERARRAARRLEAAGRVEWTQRGRRVDASDARGPVRIRRSRR